MYVWVCCECVWACLCGHVCVCSGGVCVCVVTDILAHLVHVEQHRGPQLFSSHEISSFSFSNSWVSSMCSKMVKATNIFCRWSASLGFDIMSDQHRFHFVFVEEKCVLALPNCPAFLPDSLTCWLTKTSGPPPYAEAIACHRLFHRSLCGPCYWFFSTPLLFILKPLFTQLSSQLCTF